MSGLVVFKIFLSLLELIAVIESTKLIDLSYPFNNATLYWPTVDERRFNLEIVTRGMQKQGHWLEVNKFAAPEHGGTHIDAPAHFTEGHWRVGDIPVDCFFAQAAVVNITAKAKENLDAELTLEDLLTWEGRHGELTEDHILLVNSGWSTRWPDEALYFGNDQKNHMDFHFPGVHPEASKWLVDNRKVKAVGMDTPSADCGSCGRQSHINLLGNDVYIIENMNNLDKLPATGADLYVFPMYIEEGSGSPSRVVAKLHDGMDNYSNKGWRSYHVDEVLLSNCFMYVWLLYIMN